MNDMMQMTQIRHQALREEADMRRLVKLAQQDQQPRQPRARHRTHHPDGVGDVEIVMDTVFKLT